VTARALTSGALCLVAVCVSAQTMFLDDYRPEPMFSGQTRAPLADMSPRLNVTELTSELQGPYGIAFLPDGRAIISEMAGRIRILDAAGNVSAPVQGLPAVWSQSPGAGMRDLVLDPDFANNRLIYFSYAAMPEGDLEGLDNEQRGELSMRYTARAQLSADYSRMSEVENLIEVSARRLVFAGDGTLLMTTDAATDSRDFAQDLQSLHGKVLRINPDGSIPDDNTFGRQPGVHPAVYALGLRDPSGAAIHPETGRLWTVEHGPRGGDELNVIREGINYGWPVISYGREYSQAPIGAGITAREYMDQPIYFWTPSIAPGSLMFYTGDAIPAWQGNAFVSTLSGEHISRLVLDGERVIAEERLMHGRGQRIRTIAQAPDGSVYMLTNAMPGPPGQAGGTSYVYRLTVREVRNPFSALEED
jgi:glucose/arabinose dehydrogenase